MHNAKLRLEHLVFIQRLLPLAQYPLSILRMNPAAPFIEITAKLSRPQPIQSVHLLVPDKTLGRCIHLPDADAAGFHRELNTFV